MDDPPGLPAHGTAPSPSSPRPRRGIPTWVWFLVGGAVLVIAALSLLVAIGQNFID